MILPTKFIHSSMPCLSCGGRLVLNGPSILDAEQTHRFINGEDTMVEYVCLDCPEHWGFFGSRNPLSPSFMDMLEMLTSSSHEPTP